MSLVQPNGQKSFHDRCLLLRCPGIIEEPHDELIAETRSRVIMEETVKNLHLPSPPWEKVAKRLLQIAALTPLRRISSGLNPVASGYDRNLPDMRDSRSLPGRLLAEGRLDLTTRIRGDFRFD